MFSKPNFTQTPNEFFDDIAKTLKEGELRVMLVIMRQNLRMGKQTMGSNKHFTAYRKDRNEKGCSSPINKILSRKEASN